MSKETKPAITIDWKKAWYAAAGVAIAIGILLLSYFFYFKNI